jgi:DNA-binding IclR family transcriptional regulator
VKNSGFCYTESTMAKPLKKPPPYAITSVDHALRLATMLQLEGPLRLSEVAERLGVARSTAHRLLSMLVYRDFAVQDDDRAYRAGPVLELAAHSRSLTARLRAVSLPHLQRLVDHLDESANLIVRTGATARFIASVECEQPLRVGDREGMVFPAHLVTGGLLLLAELDDDELERVYAGVGEGAGERPDLATLRPTLDRIRKQGHAINTGLSERGVVAVGHPVRDEHSHVIAGVSVSLPSVRYQQEQLPTIVAALAATSRSIEADLAREGTDPR